MNARSLCLLLALGTSSLSSASAQTAESIFHRAYFLERERGHFEEALALYQQVAQDPQAEPALQQEAARRASGVSEEIASADFAQLLPAGALLYAEFNEPGRQLSTLLEQLGLLGTFQDAAQKGSLAISPELVRGLLGIRGAAVAITRLPEGGGPPGGVLVFHPGEVGVVRGLIETAVPAGGLAVDAIEGHPTWKVEGEVLVTLTNRMVVVSQERELIAGVLRRLRGERSDAMAADASLQEYLAQRRSDLFFCCLNAAPLRPFLTQLLAQQSASDPRLAMLREVVDVGSLKAIVLRAGAGSDGLSLEASLHLEQDHRNLVFNLLRPAPIDGRTLELVPAGVAAFVATALNERGSALAPLHQNSEGAPVVTAGDLARELFANVAGIALYLLPGEGMIPNATLVLSSNDPARSQAVLGLLLGLASLATNGRSLEPEEDVVGGVDAQVFRLPPGIPLYLVTQEDALLLSPSRTALERSLEARSSGNSVQRDTAFADELGRIGPGTNLACQVHLGRLLAVARPFLPHETWSALEPVAPTVENTVVALRTEYGDARLGFSLALRGIPKIDGLVAKLLAQQKERRSVVQRAYSGYPAESLAASAELARSGALDADLLQKRFDQLALEQGDDAGARTFVLESLPGLRDPQGLNNVAWALLTEERYGQRFDDLALEIATVSNQASGFTMWQYLDTLALAKFRTGAVEEAVALEEAALQHAGEGVERGDMEESLQRFRSALGESVASDSAPR